MHLFLQRVLAKNNEFAVKGSLNAKSSENIWINPYSELVQSFEGDVSFYHVTFSRELVENVSSPSFLNDIGRIVYSPKKSFWTRFRVMHYYPISSGPSGLSIFSQREKVFFDSKKFELFEERLKKLAGRVENWVELVKKLYLETGVCLDEEAQNDPILAQVGLYHPLFIALMVENQIPFHVETGSASQNILLTAIHALDSEIWRSLFDSDQKFFSLVKLRANLFRQYLKMTKNYLLTKISQYTVHPNQKVILLTEPHLDFSSNFGTTILNRTHISFLPKHTYALGFFNVISEFIYKYARHFNLSLLEKRLIQESEAPIHTLARQVNFAFLKYLFERIRVLGVAPELRPLFFALQLYGLDPSPKNPIAPILEQLGRASIFSASS